MCGVGGFTFELGIKMITRTYITCSLITLIL